MQLKILRIIKGFLALTSFLTIIPTGIHNLEYASSYFYLVPIIGLIEGFLISIPLLLPISKLMASCLVLVLMYLITGFNHVDGFEDFVDALVSGKKGEEALRIMKSSSRGAVAVVSTVLLVIVMFSSLHNLYLTMDKNSLILVLSTVHILSAESMFVLSSISKEPPYPGLGKLFIRSSKKGKLLNLNIFILMLCILLVLSLGLSPQLILLMFVPMIISVAIIRKLAHSILGFVSGDVLGFCFEVTRTSIMVLLSCTIHLI